jgi:glycosyltransferase involved in cell wall biosynthesis
MSQKAPYFSITLPTRNRGELAEQAVQFILAQTFTDFELIIADSDETDDTVQRLKRFQDPRLRYHNTRGKTAPENFQFCADQARGEYLVFTTDRLMLRPEALQVLYQHSEARRYPNLRYHGDYYDDRQSPPKIWRPEFLSGNKTVTADELLRSFVGEENGPSLAPLMPMPQLSAIHHTMLAKIKGTQNRPIFAPIVPDMWSCFAQLSCCEDEMLNIGQMLCVGIIRMGTGSSFLQKKESGSKFLREICKNGELDMAHVPLKSLVTANMIFNDYMRARQLFGGRLESYPLPMTTYFDGVFRNFEDSLKVGTNMRAEYREWKNELKKQPIEVQDEVKRRLKNLKKSYPQLEMKRLLRKARYTLRLHDLERKIKSMRPPKKGKKPAAHYNSVAEYMARNSAMPAAK